MWRFFTNAGTEKISKQTVSSTPTGVIVSYGQATPPSGWLVCDGSEILRSAYADLDAALGTTYGAYTNGAGGAGTTHLRLPDLRGRIPVGQTAGSGNRTDTNGPLTGTGQITGGSSIAAGTLGAASGSEGITLTAAQSATPAHNHTITVGNHSHSITSSGQHRHRVGYNLFFNYINGGTSTAAASQSGSETPSGNQTTYSGGMGGSLADAKGSINASNQVLITINNKSEETASGAHNNMQPFLVVNFIIKA